MELRRLASAIWTRRWYVVAVLLTTTALAALFAAVRTERYESTSVLAITPSAEATGGLLSSSDLGTLMGTYERTAKSSVIRDEAAATLGRALDAKIDTSVESGTGILRITASSNDRVLAAEAADAVAGAFVASLDANRSITVEVVERPEPASSPADPRVGLVLAIAVMLGLGGGVLLALAVDRAWPRLDTVADVTAVTEAPVLGRIPERRTSASLDEGTDDVVAEAFRSLRTELSLRIDVPGRLILVTGPAAGAGASSVAADLAVAFASVGVDTVVVDANLRDPSQHELFGLDNASGLSSVLTGDDPKLHPTAHTHLRVLTAGPPSSTPAELLHVGGPAFLEGRHATGTLIVLDTPPLLAASETRLLASAADVVLLVVRRGTQPDDVSDALDQVPTTRSPLVGVVFNRDRAGR
jgi:Mrp family chromosome partitioning ATPase